MAENKNPRTGTKNTSQSSGTTGASESSRSQPVSTSRTQNPIQQQNVSSSRNDSADDDAEDDRTKFEATRQPEDTNVNASHRLQDDTASRINIESPKI